MADAPSPKVSPRLAIVLAASRRAVGLGLLFRSRMLVTVHEVANTASEVLLPGTSGFSVRYEIGEHHGVGGLEVLEIDPAAPVGDNVKVDQPRAGEPCTVAASDGETVAILGGRVTASAGDGSTAAFTVELEADPEPGTVIAGSPVMVAGSFVGIVDAPASGRVVEGFRVDTVIEAFGSLSPVPLGAREDETDGTSKTAAARAGTPLSDGTRRALGVAAALVEPPAQARPPGVLAAAAVIGALRVAADGQQGSVPSTLLTFFASRTSPSDAGQVLKRAAEAIGTRPPPGEVGDSVTDEQIIGMGFGPLVARAGDYVRRIGRSSSVHRRHLIAAAVNDPEPVALRQMLGAFDTRLDELCGEIRRTLARLQPDEPEEVWASILEPRPLELEGGITADAVDARRGIDLKHDYLGVRDYVTMLATVIADRRTPMPLSIGLFGEWGSGKSYFMGLLRKQVDTLQKEGGDYCEDIQHIRFNAWHYADSNLWASLGDEIFEQLAGPRANDVNTRREALRSDLSEKLECRRQLAGATERAQQESARISRQLDEARAQQETSAQSLAQAAAKSKTLRNKLADAGGKLGVGKSEQITLLAGELRGAADDLGVVGRALTGRHRWLLAVAGVVIVVLVAAAIAVGAPSWLARGGIATLAAVVTAAGVIAARARVGAAMLREIAEGVRKQSAAGTGPQLAELRAAEAKERVLEAQLSSVTEQVGKLGSELADLAPGQRLYRFVADRAEGDAYTRHLGLISTVRKDFEELTALMDDWRKANVKDDARKPIDRIVLYIDDLDRCSPQQVVDVLQAVHLLLALKLFVVVVGVDPRWLVRSLQRQYRSVLTSGAGRDDNDETWLTTPQDYLEKIFNIPFSLPSIREENFRGLLEGFAKPPPADDDTRDVDESHAMSDTDGEDMGGVLSERPADAGSPRSRRSEPRDEQPPLSDEAGGEMPRGTLSAEPESEVAAAISGSARPQPEPLTKHELDLLALLAPLVPTPREAKRVFNLYRMVRSTRNLSPASSFLGSAYEPGEYQAVVILLGMLSGHGRLLESVLMATPEDGVCHGGLLRRADTTRWTEFAAGMRPSPADGGWTNDVAGDIPGADVDSWTRLADGLAPAAAHVTLHDVSKFKHWAPLIARFSFLLSPFASELRSDERLPEPGSAPATVP